MQLPRRAFTLTAITMLFCCSALGCKRGDAPTSDPAPSARPTYDPVLEAQKEAAARNEVILTVHGDGISMEMKVKPGVQVTQEEFFARYRSLLRMGPDDSIAPVHPVPPGTHRPATTHYVQYYKGVQVVQNRWITREENGYVAYAEGKFVRGIELDAIPKVSTKEARERAIAAADRAAGTKDSGANDPVGNSGELEVFTSDPGLKSSTYHLGFTFMIYTRHPIASYLVEVDAHTGVAISSPPKISILAPIEDP